MTKLLSKLARFLFGWCMTSKPHKHQAWIEPQLRYFGGGVCVDPDLLATVTAAIANRRTLSIVYVDKKGDRTERLVFPVTIMLTREPDLGLGFGAYCTTRGDYRTFALCRVHGFERTPYKTCHGSMIDAYGWAKTVKRFGRRPRDPRIAALRDAAFAAEDQP
jgi:predicted DNA-binding transcriptional regulator YafY